MERRQKVMLMLSQKKTLKDIASELGESYDTINKDKLACMKKSISFIETMGVNSIPYLYDGMLLDIEQVKKHAYKIIVNEEELTSDRIKALKLILDSNMNKSTLIQTATNLLEIEPLKLRVEKIEQDRNTQGQINYFNQNLPELSKDSNTHDPTPL